MNDKKQMGFRATIATILLLVLVAATSLAQGGETFGGDPPKIDTTPVVLSRTVTENTINTVVEIPVSQDTYIASNSPGSNFCTSNWLRLGYNKDSPNYGAVRPFFWFNLSSIPSEAAINYASFKIYVHTATPSGDSPMRVESRHLLNPWDACQVTWDSHQPDWGAIMGAVYVPSTLGWFEVEATHLVREWVYGTHANHGAIMIGDENVQERQRGFYSSYDTGGRYPRLIVDYTEHVDQEPPVVTVHSLPTWSRQRFDVTWSGYDPGDSGIAYYDVQYRPAGGNWINWLLYTQLTTAEFVGGANGTTYEFRARGVDNAGNVQDWSPTAQAWTMVDSVEPTATVASLPPVTYDEIFIVSWSGSDNPGGSGLLNYDVQYQIDGGAWQDWLVDTTSTQAQATGAQHGVTYGFRARATDVAGNTQSWSPTAQASTTANTVEPTAWVLNFSPPVSDTTQFMVYWDGTSSSTTPIVGFEVRYRFRQGGWVLWQSSTLTKEALFTDVGTQDGYYCFEARATDSAGRTSAYGGTACMYIDREAPFLAPVAYMPAVSFP